MPTYSPIARPRPIEIDRFLGINEATGETGIQMGEMTYMRNWRTTKDYKLQKRDGYSKFIDFGTGDVQGMWHGILGGNELMIVCQGGHVYEYDMSVTTSTTAIADLLTASTVTDVGTITDAKTTIFWFESKLYFINGTDYKEYDGSTYQDVVPYVPTIAIETPPAGGGTDYEQVNLLTGQKKQEFAGDSTSDVFQLREIDIDSVDSVTVDGVTKTVTTHYTVSLADGTVTFTAGNTPASDAIVVVTWTNTIAGNADLVKGNKYAIDFGPANDTAVFLWGHSTYKNKIVWCGTLDASYWPEFNFNLIGSDEFAVTDIAVQYSRQIIFKEHRTYYSQAEYNSTTGVYDYPVYDLNETIGNAAYGGVQLVNNSPISLYGKSLYQWTSTNVETEINAVNISERIRNSLAGLDLSTAVTFDYQQEKELWVNIGSLVYIFNYGNDTYYIYDNVSATRFLDVDGTVYFGTDGTVEKFGGLNDNGTSITARAETGFMDFGSGELRKNTRIVFASLFPYTRTSLDMYFVTDRINEEEAKTIKSLDFGWMNFADTDFEDFYFTTNQNPQTFRRKLRARKYSFIKFIFENPEEEDCVLLGFKIVAEANGYVR